MSDDQVGWSGSVMRWLGRLTQVVEISVAWWLLTAGGLVLAGWAPSGTACTRALQRIFADDPSSGLWHDLFSDYRAAFAGSNRAAWPWTLAALATGADLAIVGTASRVPVVFVVPVVLVAILVLLSGGFLLSLLATGPASPSASGRLRRAALTLPLLSPATTLAWLLTVGAIALAGWVLPWAGILAGPGAALLANAWLTGRRLAQTGVAVSSAAQAATVDSRTFSS